MGPLTLPSGGLIYIDTPVFIYSIEKHGEYWPLLQPLWRAAQTGSLQPVTSELALLETLVGPLKAGDITLASAYEQLFLSTEIQVVPITTAILKDAARLRADLGFRTPDAIHAATALAISCTMLITNDTVFRRLDALPVVVLRYL